MFIVLVTGVSASDEIYKYGGTFKWDDMQEKQKIRMEIYSVEEADYVVYAYGKIYSSDSTGSSKADLNMSIKDNGDIELEERNGVTVSGDEAYYANGISLGVINKDCSHIEAIFNGLDEDGTEITGKFILDAIEYDGETEIDWCK